MVPFLKNDVPTFSDISANSDASVLNQDIAFGKALRRVAAYVRRVERSFTSIEEAIRPTSF